MQDKFNFSTTGALALAAALLMPAAASSQPLAMNDPGSRYPASIFERAMPQEREDSITPEAGDAELPAHLRRQVVSYQGREAPGTVIVDTPNTYLYYVMGNGQAMRYGIGVGREGFTWSGVQNVTRKAEWPDWNPPAEMIARQPYLPRFMAGGPGNPLGARAMYLGNSIYRIHGTNAPSTIGGRVSSGCIRMLNEDVSDLYNRVRVGSKVVVMPDSRNRAPDVATTQPAERVSSSTLRPRAEVSSSRIY